MEELLNPRHPHLEFHEQQLQALQALPAEQQAEMARLFRLGNASYRYHQLAAQAEPTETDFEEWLTGLPDRMRRAMQAEGFAKCRTTQSFTRYVLEKRDIGYAEFMQSVLQPDDWAYEQQLAQQDIQPSEATAQ